LTAEAIARALGGHRAGGGFLVRCPVPGHGRGQGDRRPSLMLRDGDRRLLVHCFAGCDPRDVVAVLRLRGFPGEEPGDRGSRAVRPMCAAATTPSGSTAAALRLWQSSLPVAGTLAERYLVQHRGLRPPFPASLRFTPGCIHPRLRRAFPALVAAVQAFDGRLTAVQATWLSSDDGRKAFPGQPRWTFGTLGDGAVRLGPAASVVGLTEGVEDALAVSQLSQLSQPFFWSCLGAGRMDRVRVPDEVREIHIFADDDEAGRRAAERTARVNHDAGRRVLVRLPPRGFKDWGEVAGALYRRAAA